MIFRKKEPSFYDLESKRIQEQLMKLTPGTEEYRKNMDELIALRKFAGEEKEMNQIFTKEGRGGIVGKIVGFLGLGGLALGIAKFEKDGHIFSGQSNGFIKGIISIGTRLFG